MKLSVVVLCCDEMNTIEEVLELVISAPGSEKEVIVVDDCSTVSGTA